MRNQTKKLPAGEWIHDKYEAGRLSPLSEDERKPTITRPAEQRQTSEIQLYQPPRRNRRLSPAGRPPHQHDRYYLPDTYEPGKENSKELVLHQAPPPREHQLTPAERGVLETDKYRPAYADSFSTNHRFKEREREREREAKRENHEAKSCFRKPLVYISQDHLISRKARDAGVSAMEYSLVRERMVKEVDGKYSSADYSDHWRLWRSEYKLWYHYFGMEWFPGEEPQQSTQNDLMTPHSYMPQRSAFNGYKSTTSSASDLRRNLRRNSPEAMRQSDSPPEEQYAGLESTMELKAIARGGHVLRRDFFRFLNRTRHDINEQHPGCTRGAKAHVVDVKVWNQFFLPEPFPGVPPVRGHSDICLARSNTPVASGPAQPPMPRSKTWINPALLSQHPSSSRQLAFRPARQPSGMKREEKHTIFNHNAMIHQVGATPSINNAIGETPVARQSARSTIVQAGSVNRKIINTEILRVKTQQLLSRQSSNPSGSSNKPVKAEAKIHPPPPYKNVMGASELDSLLVEEAAKVEGASRKVVDEECGEVVTLEEYTRRIKLRALQSVGMKRKADSEGGDNGDVAGSKKMRF